MICEMVNKYNTLKILVVFMILINVTFGQCNLARPDGCFNNLKNLVNSVTSSTNNVKNRISTVSKDLTNIGSGLSKMGQIISDNKNKIQNRISQLDTLLNNKVVDTFDNVNEIKDTLGQTAETIKNELNDIFTSLKNTLNGFLDSAGEFELPNNNDVRNLQSTLETCFNNVFGDSKIVSIIQGMLNTLSLGGGPDKISQLTKAMSTIAVSTGQGNVFRHFCDNYQSFLIESGKNVIANINFDQVSDIFESGIGSGNRRLLNKENKFRNRHLLGYIQIDSSLCNNNNGMCNATQPQYSSHQSIKNILGKGILSNTNEYTNALRVSKVKETLLSFETIDEAVLLLCASLAECDAGVEDIAKCIGAIICKLALHTAFHTAGINTLEWILNTADIHDGIILTDEMNTNVINIDIINNNQFKLVELIDNNNNINNQLNQMDLSISNLNNQFTSITTQTIDQFDLKISEIETNINQLQNITDSLLNKMKQIHEVLTHKATTTTTPPSNLPTSTTTLPSPVPSKTPSKTPSQTPSNIPSISPTSLLNNILCMNNKINFLLGDWEHDISSCKLSTTVINAGSNVWIGSSDGLIPNLNYSLPNFELETKLSIVSGVGVGGPCFRFQRGDGLIPNGGERYFFGIDIQSNEIAIMAMDDGDRPLILRRQYNLTENEVLEYNKNYTLKVTGTSNGIYNFYVNNQIIQAWEDYQFPPWVPPYTNGSIGFRSSLTITNFYTLTYKPL